MRSIKKQLKKLNIKNLAFVDGMITACLHCQNRIDNENVLAKTSVVSEANASEARSIGDANPNKEGNANQKN